MHFAAAVIALQGLALDVEEQTHVTTAAKKDHIRVYDKRSH